MKNLFLSTLLGLFIYISLEYTRINFFSVNFSFLVSNLILLFSSLLAGTLYYSLEKKVSVIIPTFLVFYSATMLFFNRTSNFLEWRFSESRAIMVKHLDDFGTKKSITTNDFLHYNDLSKIPAIVLANYSYAFLGGFIIIKLSKKNSIEKKLTLNKISRETIILFLLLISSKILTLLLNKFLADTYIDLSMIASTSIFLIKGFLDLFAYFLILLIGTASFKDKKIKIINIFILSLPLAVVLSLFDYTKLNFLLLLIQSAIKLPTVFAILILGKYIHSIKNKLPKF